MPLVPNNEIRGRQATLGQFFTKGQVSQVLANFLDGHHGASILDLGAGDGRLSRSVSSAWELSRVVTVDVDARVRPQIPSSPHFHIHGDALDVELPRQLAADHGQFDLAVCNPPYVKQAWRHEFGRILEEAGLSEVCPAFPDARGEILFLAQLLRIIKPGGQVGLIVPDGPIAGERYINLRAHLLRHHGVERVVSLPSGMFVGTEARAHILILRKGTPAPAHVTLMELNSNGDLSPAVQVTADEAAQRMDYAFHAARQKSSGRSGISLRDAGAVITRGTVSSAEICTLVPTFHTSDFPPLDERVGICLESGFPLADDRPSAGPGDILVARVGRSLESKICRVTAGYAYISDCIFRVRVPLSYSQWVYDALVSEKGASYLKSVSRGVGARYITVRALLDFSL